MSKLKQLPRDDQGQFTRRFTANGQKYIIRSQDEGIGAIRYSMLMKSSSTIVFAQDVGTQVRNWQQLDKLLSEFARGKIEISHVGAFIHNVLDGISTSSKQRYVFSFWVCTLFIVREDEDMTKWVEAEQAEKIDDWNAEGIHENEFFELVKKKLVEFSSPLPA